MARSWQWSGLARRMVYYRPTRRPARVRPELAGPIKRLVEEEPAFGYRTVAALLGMNKNTVQRIFQLKGGWQAVHWPSPAAFDGHSAQPALVELRATGDWIAFYNQRRPHQALKMGTPRAA